MMNVHEALRYAGVPVPDAALMEEMTALARQAEELYAPRWVFQVFPLAREPLRLCGTRIDLPGKLADGMLRTCDRAAVLVCTLGAKFDRALRQEQHRDIRRALLMDACASALVENGCDRAEEELRGHLPGVFLTDRFSPGYGDLPMDLQPLLLRAVGAGTRLGVTATDTHLLLPQKSTTALIGLSPTPQAAKIRGCQCCSLRAACTKRKAGITCASDIS